jgi:hypothetical protein
MRTIESPGVEIKEIDLSFNTELPNGTTSLVLGYAKQGPTDELLNITSSDELEQVYGLPENSAERYMYQTAKQVLNANGNLLITRLPYGSGDGEGYTTKYSALVYPYIPVDTATPCETYAVYLSAGAPAIIGVASVGAGYNVTTSAFSVADAANAVCVSNVNGQAFNFTATFNDSISGLVDATLAFNTSGGVIVAGSTHTVLSAYPVLSAGNWTGFFTQASLASSQVYAGETAPVEVYTATVSADSSSFAFVSGTISTSVASDTLSGNVPGTADGASHYFLGQPIHMSIDEDTYFSWLQGGINWESTVTNGVSGLMDSTDALTILANVGYGALIVVNEAKTTITDQFEGYYVAIADNSKMDKGSNFDSIENLKSFNQFSEDNEWMTLNQSSLAFTLTGSFSEHSGSVSEIIESVPNFDFSNIGKGGFGDSVVVTLFKVRPTIYNQNTRVLDKVLYESYIGSFDSTRQLQNQNGGAPSNFFIEDVINKNSSTMKVFVNPYISKFSGTWLDSQNQEPTKFVRVVCEDRDMIGTERTDVIGVVPAEPHATAKIIFDSINTSKNDFCKLADSMYGVGEPVPCNSLLAKSIGNLPRKLEKALRLAENYELLRIDLVPEAGLGTVWTGMNLDMSNWPSNATNRTEFSRTKEIFDENVYINGILNPHTFDADSAGLLDQDTGSASEANDLYESISGIFNQFCQYTRKDCLHIADPLRYIFVQGIGDVKVMDNKKLNFSQHMFWPLKNLFGGLNSSFACTYANWFKVNDTISDRFVWAPSSGYAANLMIKTDTNFFPWYAPAGLTRGILTGILDIGINPSQKQRDLLYKNGINPTVYWPGDGYVVWGQKTLQRKPSAFDRINVRRLFLWAEKAVLQIARYFVFEQNTPFTRNRLRAAIEPVLGYARSNEGIYDYLIVCDDRNNPPEVIDRNELIVDIYIKPVRVAEFILINFIATRTGQKFEELI